MSLGSLHGGEGAGWKGETGASLVGQSPSAWTEALPLPDLGPLGVSPVPSRKWGSQTLAGLM